jgi:hypothetical protein
MGISKFRKAFVYRIELAEVRKRIEARHKQNQS